MSPPTAVLDPPPPPISQRAGRPHYALNAGTCSALGSFFGKLTGAESRSLLHSRSPASLAPLTATLTADSWLPTLLFGGLMLLSNAMVWSNFVRALHSAGGSVVATVVSASTNYALSALLGCVVFGERTSPLWWCGTALVLAGLVLIATDEQLVATGDDDAGGKTSADKETTVNDGKKNE